MLYSLTYGSSAAVPFSPQDLRELLQRSCAHNARAGITGLLLYRGGNFIQVLEGEELAVRALYGRIAADPRHGGTIVLLQGPIGAREFADWSMAFRDLDAPDTLAVPGFSDFLHTPLDPAALAAAPSRARKLLLLFKQQMR